MTLKCYYCQKQPHEISEYVDMAKSHSEYMKPGHEVTPEQVVIGEEGTYHSETKLFSCTSCYIKHGMPLNNDLHRAFQRYRRDVEPLVQ